MVEKGCKGTRLILNNVQTILKDIQNAYDNHNVKTRIILENINRIIIRS